MTTTPTTPDRGGLLVSVPFAVAGVTGMVASLQTGATLFVPVAGVLLALAAYVEIARRRPSSVWDVGPVAPLGEVEKLYLIGVVSGLLLPVLGLVVGIVLLGKSASLGVRVVIGSIGSALVWAFVWAAFIR